MDNPHRISESLVPGTDRKLLWLFDTEHESNLEHADDTFLYPSTFIAEIQRYIFH